MSETKIKFQKIILPYFYSQLTAGAFCSLLYYCIYYFDLVKHITWNGVPAFQGFTYIVITVCAFPSYYILSSRWDRYNKSNFDLNHALSIAVFPTMLFIGLIGLSLNIIFPIFEVEPNITRERTLISLGLYLLFSLITLAIIFGKPLDPKNILSDESRSLNDKHLIKILLLILMVITKKI